MTKSQLSVDKKTDSLIKGLLTSVLKNKVAQHIPTGKDSHGYIANLKEEVTECVMCDII